MESVPNLFAQVLRVQTNRVVGHSFEIFGMRDTRLRYELDELCGHRNLGCFRKFLNFVDFCATKPSLGMLSPIVRVTGG